MATPHSSGALQRTRPETRTRKIPHTIDGRTELVDDEYTVHVPVPPRDWDHLVLQAVTAIAVLSGAASLAWTTTSIGGLLHRVAPAPAAYGAALVFDLVWLSCMALEWLARYDTQRARAPRIAGNAALLVAMSAVAAHGWTSGQLIVGTVGALVSGLIKGLWTLVLRHHAKPLDRLTQQWVDKQRADAGGRLAMMAVRRELARAEGMLAAEAATQAQPDTPHTTTETRPDTDTDAPDTTVRPIRPSAREAVRTALASGITDPDAVLRYVRTTADAEVSEETVARYRRAFGRTATA